MKNVFSHSPTLPLSRFEIATLCGKVVVVQANCKR
jgi:hypothetical protein